MYYDEAMLHAYGGSFGKTLTFSYSLFILTFRCPELRQNRRPDARVAQWQRNRLVIGRLAGSTPLSGLVLNLRFFDGEVPEWFIGTVCKTVALTGFGGSNPPLSTTI